MRLTYGMLLEQLKTLNEEQLAKDVIMYDVDEDECYMLNDFDIVGEEDFGAGVVGEENFGVDARPGGTPLGEGHPYLIF